jgi:hypothetical protein
VNKITHFIIEEHWFLFTGHGNQIWFCFFFLLFFGRRPKSWDEIWNSTYVIPSTLHEHRPNLEIKIKSYFLYFFFFGIHYSVRVSPMKTNKKDAYNKYVVLVTDARGTGFNFFVSIFIQSYVNGNLHVSTLYTFIIHRVDTCIAVNI